MLAFVPLTWEKPATRPEKSLVLVLGNENAFNLVAKTQKRQGKMRQCSRETCTCQIRHLRFLVPWATSDNILREEVRKLFDKKFPNDHNDCRSKEDFDNFKTKYENELSTYQQIYETWAFANVFEYLLNCKLAVDEFGREKLEEFFKQLPDTAFLPYSPADFQYYVDRCVAFYIVPAQWNDDPDKYAEKIEKGLGAEWILERHRKVRSRHFTPDENEEIKKKRVKSAFLRYDEFREQCHKAFNEHLKLTTVGAVRKKVIALESWEAFADELRNTGYDTPDSWRNDNDSFSMYVDEFARVVWAHMVHLFSKCSESGGSLVRSQLPVTVKKMMECLGKEREFFRGVPFTYHAYCNRNTPPPFGRPVNEYGACMRIDPCGLFSWEMHLTSSEEQDLFCDKWQDEPEFSERDFELPIKLNAIPSTDSEPPQMLEKDLQYKLVGNFEVQNRRDNVRLWLYAGGTLDSTNGKAPSARKWLPVSKIQELTSKKCDVPLRLEVCLKDILQVGYYNAGEVKRMRVVCRVADSTKMCDLHIDMQTEGGTDWDLAKLQGHEGRFIEIWGVKRQMFGPLLRWDDGDGCFIDPLETSNCPDVTMIAHPPLPIQDCAKGTSMSKYFLSKNPVSPVRDGDLTTHFRNFRGELVKLLYKYDYVVGVVAWFTDEDIFKAMFGKCLGLVALKIEEYRLEQGNLIAQDKQDQGRLIAQDKKGKGLGTWGEVLVWSNIVGNAEEDGYVHSKFLVFGSWEEEQFVPKAVWTGSFNLTGNGCDKLIENAVVIEREATAKAYFEEFKRVFAFVKAIKEEPAETSKRARIGDDGEEMTTT